MIAELITAGKFLLFILWARARVAFPLGLGSLYFGGCVFLLRAYTGNHF
jgi:hypothetical protein